MGDWREQAFVWRGDVEVMTRTTGTRDENGAVKELACAFTEGRFPKMGEVDDESKIFWGRLGGSWQSYTEEDARKCEDTDMKFHVEGAAVVKRYSRNQNIIEYTVDSSKKKSSYLLDNGDGLKKHYDKNHTIWIREECCFDSTHEVVARGHNEFGHFVSYGYLEVGNNTAFLTLARRYVDSNDWRLKEGVDELMHHAFSSFRKAGNKDHFLQHPHLHVPLYDSKPEERKAKMKRDSSSVKERGNETIKKAKQTE